MTQQQRAEETRSQIRQAALELFAQSGYDNTSVAEICTQAGVTKGAFYFHFPSKQALFIDLLNRWLDGLDDRLRAARQPGVPVTATFERLAGAVGGILSETRGQLPMFIEFWDQARHDPVIWQATIEPYRRYRDFFAEWIEQGIAEGSIRPVDAQNTARIIVSLAVGLVLQAQVDPEGADWGQVFADSMAFLVAALEKRE